MVIINSHMLIKKTWIASGQTRLISNHTHTHTHPFNGPFSGSTQVSRYQKGKTNLDFTEARDSEWHWHQLGHMQVSTSLQTDNHASTPPLSFLQAGCPSCRPTNSIKALNIQSTMLNMEDMMSKTSISLTDVLQYCSNSITKSKTRLAVTTNKYLVKRNRKLQ